MEILVHFSGVPVTLETNGFSGRIDIDQLTSIDYGNLYGEAVTVSALLNKVGLLRAEAEQALAEKKLERDVCEANACSASARSKPTLFRRALTVTASPYKLP